MAEKDASNNEDLMAEFAEFLEAKRASEQETKDSEDFDVEIWDEKGRGVRTKRSHAKPFLQSLGIDVDPPKNDGVDDDKDGTKNKSTKRTATPPKSTVQKYFTAKGK
jgi:hypothetical protein